MTNKSARSPLPVEKAVAIRNDYVAGMTVRDICRKHQVSQWTAYHCLAGGPLVNGKRMFEPIPLRGTIRLRSTDRKKLVQRLWQAADAHAQTLEGRLKKATAPAERESATRAMAVLVKTVRDLLELDAARPDPKVKPGAEPPPEVKDDDPREIDEFRRELARRIAALDAAATGEIAGDI